MTDIDETLDIEEEGVGGAIRLGTLIGLLLFPGLIKAADVEQELGSKKPNVVNVMNAIDAVAKKTKVGDYTYLQATNIIARTLWGEARGEGTDGIDAVASVLYNRAGGKIDNLPSVCLKKSQFSMWNDLSEQNKSAANYLVKIPKGAVKPAEKAIWNYCQKTAGKLLDGSFKSTIGTKNSYYAHNKVTPSWSSKMSDTEKIGNHTFGYLADQDGFATKTKAKSSISKKVQPVKQTNVASKKYTIKDGDTLWKLAKNNKTTVDNILKLNKKLNPKKLKVGSTIYIPA